jgi:flagellar basal body-associated protein FliL
MVELTPAEYEVVNRWLVSASQELDQSAGPTNLAQAIKAMIQATAADHVVSDVVLDHMRAEQS